MREQYLYAANYGIMAQSGMNVGAAFNGVGAYKEVTKVAENGVKTVTKEAASGGLKAVVGEKAMENIAVKAGMAMAETYTAGVASSFVGAIGSDDYWGVVREAAVGKSALANVMSAGAGSLGGSMIGKLDAEFAEKYGKTLKFGTAMAGETARYATYVGYSITEDIIAENFDVDFGNYFVNAFDEMDFTASLVNLGDIVDLFDGTGTSWTASALSGTGLFELHLNSQGVKAGKLGTGGVDVSLGTVGNMAVAGGNGLVAAGKAVWNDPDILKRGGEWLQKNLKTPLANDISVLLADALKLGKGDGTREDVNEILDNAVGLITELAGKIAGGMEAAASSKEGESALPNTSPDFSVKIPKPLENPNTIFEGEIGQVGLKTGYFGNLARVPLNNGWQNLTLGAIMQSKPVTGFFVEASMPIAYQTSLFFNFSADFPDYGPAMSFGFGWSWKN
jgi:hypothetical protein